MKKSNIILALMLTWLSVFSLVITPGLAIKWPYFDHETYEIEANNEIKMNVKDLYDHHITFEYNATYEYNETIGKNVYYNVSMLFIYKAADTAYKGNFSDISEENMTILNPILNIETVNNYTSTEKWRVPDNERYEIIFINRNSVNVEVTLTIMKEEIGTIAYIFGGIVSVLFFVSVFIIVKKRSKLLQNDEEPETQ